MRSIKSKILSIYIFLIFLIFVIGLVSIYNLYSLNKSIDGLIAANYRSIITAKNMAGSIERQDSIELMYIQVDRDETIKSFYENQKEFIAWMTRARDNITESSEKKVIEEIEKNYRTYTDNFLKLQEIRNTSGSIQAGNFYSNSIYPVFSSISKLCGELVIINENAMFKSKNNATIRSRNEMYATAVLSICLIVLGLTVAVFYTRRIVKPLNMLISGVKSIKEGNLNYEIDASARDEIGELAQEFNNMSKRLSLYEKSNVKNLIAEKNKSLAIVKSISDPVIVTDNNYKILLVNKSAENVFKISEKDALGRHILESINNEDIFRRVKNSADSTCREAESNIIKIKKHDKPNYYIFTASSILDDDRRVIGTVTVLQDITGLKEIEQMKSDFISTASHELRTPLTSIIMGTELMLDNTMGSLNEEQREVVRAMDEDSKHLLEIVNDLLNLSKIESGRLHLNLENIAVEEIIKQSVKSLSDIAEDRGVELSYDLPGNLPLVYADSQKILSVINNLITNALKFTQRGDKIEVSAWAEASLLKICVSDTGIGIPEEYHKKIFERFVQVSGEASNEGSGLGLAIAREFVKKHGGDIWVESAPGRGSRFTFTLPVQL